MNLNFNQSLAKNYTSESQKIRVLSEDWVAKQSYCPSCNAEPLVEFANNQRNLVKISAEDEQGALLKAQELYRNEDVVLYPDNLIDTKFNIFKYG